MPGFHYLLIRTVILFLIFSPSNAEAETSKSSLQPNIVLIVMDNFGYGEIGLYGGGVLRGAPTPHIDSIGREERSSENGAMSSSMRETSSCFPAFVYIRPLCTSAAM